MKVSRKFIFLIILFILLFICLFESFRFFPVSSIGFNFSFILRFFILLLNFFALTVLFYCACIKNKNLQESLRKFFVILYAIVMLFYLLEGFFIFYPKSHTTGNTALSNVAWASYYNRPFNEYNFRGALIGKLEDKKKIYVIGDSYTCGWGIRDFNQRYPEVLERKLGPGYRVINMGVPGFGTKDELYVLNQFINVYDLKKPDLIIWQYLINDIVTINSKTKFEAYSRENFIIKYFIRNSFFFNFLYWVFPQEYDQDYTDFIIRNFISDEEKVKAHLKDVLMFVLMCREKEIPLIVVGFPYLNDLQKTCPTIFSLSQISQNFNVEFINVCRLAQDMTLEDRQVHYNDHHPSASMHQLIAEELYRRIKEKGL